MYIADRTKYAAMRVKAPQSLGLFSYDGNLIGGSMIGVGMAFTGACPGTVLVQSGVGGIESGSYALLGGIIGGMAFVLASPYIQRLRTSFRHTSTPPASPSASCHTVLLSTSGAGGETIHATFNLNPSTILLVWEAFCLTILYFASTYDPSQGHNQIAGLTTPVVGGLAIGAAQAAVILLTRHPVGCSKVYQNIGHYLQSTLVSGKIDTSVIQHLRAPATIFAAGIISAGAILAKVFPPLTNAILDDSIVPAKALIGGAAMAFGASLAGGCTSGHGISGLATFSFASFASVAAMFGSGILTALLIS